MILIGGYVTSGWPLLILGSYGQCHNTILLRSWMFNKHLVFLLFNFLVTRASLALPSIVWSVELSCYLLQASLLSFHFSYCHFGCCQLVELCCHVLQHPGLVQAFHVLWLACCSTCSQHSKLHVCLFVVILFELLVVLAVFVINWFVLYLCSIAQWFHVLWCFKVLYVHDGTNLLLFFPPSSNYKLISVSKILKLKQTASVEALLLLAVFDVTQAH